MRIALALVPLAYLLGTFPSAELVARAGRRDVRREGSGNPGATNVARLMGWRAGLVVLAADSAKGAVAAGVGLVVAGRGGGFLLGVSAVVGHVAPVARRFRGGRGVATAGGALLVLFPLIVVPLTFVWLVLSRAVRVASIASLTVTVAFPAAVALTGAPAPEVGATVVLAAVIVLRHLPNIRRLLRGGELHIDGPPEPTDGR